MPEYCRHCPACDLRFSVTVPMREAHAIRCPKCSGAVDIDVAAQGAPGMPRTEFHGTEQKCHEIRCQPKDVEYARSRFDGSGAAHCWQNDGRVKFKHKAEADAFFGRLGSIRQRSAEKLASQPAPRKTQLQRDLDRAVLNND